ncbi:MAG: methyltransferase domain-containing protein [Firmicutes bacterium]|nr:methyltransferase domain-containing protein [Bacillota bacterium]
MYTEKTSFWDKTAAIYDLFPEVFNRKSTNGLSAYVKGMTNKTDNVLECACGTGMLSRRIAPCCKRLYATDFSIEMLKRAKKNCGKYRNISFKRADITKLKFPDNTFDVVIAANVIHLLDDPQTALKELMRVCKKDGKIIIPTYIAQKIPGKTRSLIKVLSRSGANFKNIFSYESYKEFFREKGIDNAEFTFIDGRIPCAVAVIRKENANG